MSVKIYRVELYPDERDALVRLLHLTCMLSIVLKNDDVSQTLRESLKSELEHLLSIVQPALWEPLCTYRVPVNRSTDS